MAPRISHAAVERARRRPSLTHEGDAMLGTRRRWSSESRAGGGGGGGRGPYSSSYDYDMDAETLRSVAAQQVQYWVCVLLNLGYSTHARTLPPAGSSCTSYIVYNARLSCWTTIKGNPAIHAALEDRNTSLWAIMIPRPTRMRTCCIMQVTVQNRLALMERESQSLKQKLDEVLDLVLDTNPFTETEA